jgi:pimeloyl-ACP methyl ester carboxylesterase
MLLFSNRGKTVFLALSVMINVGLVVFWVQKAYTKRVLNQRNPESTFIQNKWNGYDIVEFTYKGSPAKIVIPENPNSKRDWVWRTQFWGEQPQVDVALLEKGFHVVFVDVIDLYGGDAAITRFNDFYKFVIKNFDLYEKVVLEGLSRGGLDAYNWASVNTDKVYCIYADAPVCDLKSWPAGQGKGVGSKDDLHKMLKVYGLTEETLSEFSEMPLFNCTRVAKAGIPVIHVCGDNDDVVPFEENTLKLAEAFRAAGGEIKIIIKEGAGHHPHSLTDPAPIVQFILDKTGNGESLQSSL